MAYSNEKILYDRHGAVARITINNPAKHNAISGDMWTGLLGAFQKATADDEVRVVVIAGAGEAAFASGADLSQTVHTAPQTTHRDVLRLMRKFPKPLIAEIRGFCLGGGLAIALQADLRVAAEGSAFSVPAAKLGLAYSYEMIGRVISVIGQSQTRRLLLVGDRMDAAEALRIGLVDELHPASRLASRINELTQTIATNAPLSVRGMKTIIDEILAHPGEPETEAARAAYEACLRSADVEEGRLSFIEKRRPNFLGH